MFWELSFLQDVILGVQVAPRFYEDCLTTAIAALCTFSLWWINVAHTFEFHKGRIILLGDLTTNHSHWTQFKATPRQPAVRPNCCLHLGFKFDVEDTWTSADRVSSRVSNWKAVLWLIRSPTERTKQWNQWKGWWISPNIHVVNEELPFVNGGCWIDNNVANVTAQENAKWPAHATPTGAMAGGMQPLDSWWS